MLFCLAQLIFAPQIRAAGLDNILAVFLLLLPLPLPLLLLLSLLLLLLLLLLLFQLLRLLSLTLLLLFTNCCNTRLFWYCCSACSGCGGWCPSGAGVMIGVKQLLLCSG